MADRNPLYYFLDIDLKTRHVVHIGTERKATVQVQLEDGLHRVFLSKGQFNKLEHRLLGLSG
ncbi:MAG: hypothetical protein JJ896_06060 [Rhodothermales bacterium]|nr:hypothetical protein [Rhodothermales bacterium]MBO6779197.1 hypothetical protein [Rhodothermales bacterium]